MYAHSFVGKQAKLEPQLQEQYSLQQIEKTAALKGGDADPLSAYNILTALASKIKLDDAETQFSNASITWWIDVCSNTTMKESSKDATHVIECMKCGIEYSVVKRPSLLAEVLILNSLNSSCKFDVNTSDILPDTRIFSRSDSESGNFKALNIALQTLWLKNSPLVSMHQYNIFQGRTYVDFECEDSLNRAQRSCK